MRERRTAQSMWFVLGVCLATQGRMWGAQNNDIFDDPTPVTGLSATGVSPTQIDLKWDAPTNNVRVEGYRIERFDGTDQSANWTTPSANYRDTGLAPNSPYTYRVTARYASDREGAPALATAWTLPGENKEPPNPPSDLKADVSFTQVKLTWKGSDDTDLAGYRIERFAEGRMTLQQDVSKDPTEHTDAVLSPGLKYIYQVRAYDRVGNFGAPSNQVEVQVEAPRETIAPSVPSALRVAAVYADQVDLTWIASFDSGGSGLAGYAIKRSTDGVNFFQIAVTGSVGFSDRGLSYGTFYWYRVYAFDHAGNQSGSSHVTNATTLSLIEMAKQLTEGGEGQGVCGLVGLDLILPIGLLWLARRRRLKTVMG